MRGKNSFQEVFDKPLVEKGDKKGRSTGHLARRNECIAHRYYYYGHYSDKRYNAIITLLSEEFFLSVATIPNIIQDNIEALQLLKKRQPSVYFFQARWPHMKWQ
ncbi:MAG: hypothetical protein H0X33_07255 [Taibaiella sp.]|nr:hypothetical protein [Taibaiella sp.]